MLNLLFQYTDFQKRYQRIQSTITKRAAYNHIVVAVCEFQWKFTGSECAGESYNMRRVQAEEGKGVDRQMGECVGYGDEISGLTAVTD